MNLVIAEKPSVASNIAKILGATSKKEGYFEGNGYLVSWCIGHLVTLAPAESYNPDYEKWKLADLPIIPDDFQFQVTEGKEKQVKTLHNLLHLDVVDTVINACDAGREGELIFRLVYDFVCCTKPVKRLWISSMEDMAIREGFDNLIDGAEMEHLYQSALCRAKADWIVGINASRLFSCLYNQSLNVGRVMSPTLSMIVERNAKISAFIPMPFYSAVLRWGDVFLTSKRFEQVEQGEALLETCKNTPVVVQEVEEKERTQNPPTLYDLTTLQRIANRKLGFTAQQTLDYVQSLYEKKIVTYPRTDSKYLTSDMEHSLPQLSRIALNLLGNDGENYVPNTKNVVNSEKVSDHHAIIPTLALENYNTLNLPHGEKEVLLLICSRLLSAMASPHRFLDTHITATCGKAEFTARGKKVLEQGFLALERGEEEENQGVLPLTGVGEVLDISDFNLHQGTTTPPKQYTEDTILYAMEKAGREEEVETEFCGIGTPATRAAILEKLVSVNLLQRVGNGKNLSLVPSSKGHALITVLPESVQSPLLTSGWEEKLKAIEQGELTSDEFMGEVVEMISSLVGTYEVVKNSQTLFPSKYQAIGCCPRCGNQVVDTPKAYSCEDKSCGFILWKENKFFTTKGKKITEKIAKELLTTGKTHLKGCYSEKTGKNYDCTIFLDDDGGKYVSFKIEFANQGGKK